MSHAATKNDICLECLELDQLLDIHRNFGNSIQIEVV